MNIEDWMQANGHLMARIMRMFVTDDAWFAMRDIPQMRRRYQASAKGSPGVVAGTARLWTAR
ncbi:hypothetical protein GURKE_01250 [Brevundimonas phage vB_BpoS-Gurke]|uniref:Uncharacterized protein n=1 Tax=Brevundimonas phage vB_BpoS-Gurke TaxID=2948599 RepID=A0A9E7N4Q6_9CAUD|nr:hypothetical protein GURKE_01250 [Brevundimonas phage vB_BpoS-Gurke]